MSNPTTFRERRKRMLKTLLFDSNRFFCVRGRSALNSEDSRAEFSLRLSPCFPEGKGVSASALSRHSETLS